MSSNENQANAGAIYLLTSSSGHTKVTLVYSVSNQSAPSGADIAGYDFSGTVAITAGKLITVNSYGGVHGHGTVLDLGGATAINPVVLHAFTDSSTIPYDGSNPVGGLVQGAGGNFFGSTNDGGPNYNGGFNDGGTVYRIRASTAAPDFVTLHAFGAAGDGSGPTGGSLAIDAAGRLFGATVNGGANSQGTVFMLQQNTGGTPGWTEQVIHSFGATNDFAAPNYLSNVVVDPQGNVYGCAPSPSSPAGGRGGVYRLSPPATAGGAWTETILYSFNGRIPSVLAGSYGCDLAYDSGSGIIYGTTPYGGKNEPHSVSGNGTIFELLPPPNAKSGWRLAMIHSFYGTAVDGGLPVSPPFKLGNTYYGGNSQNGAIYAVTIGPK